jgi:putative holliday junction resolvase
MCYTRQAMAVALGLDVGERRIGVARSDSWGLLATPLTTIVRQSDRMAVDAVTHLVATEGATHLVVGLPLSVTGSTTDQAQRIAAFARKLRARSQVPVVFWNERYSTAIAAERLREMDVLQTGAGDADGRPGAPRRVAARPPPSRYRREQARRREDAAAAAVILQDFLDQNRSTAPPVDGEGAGPPPGASTPD